MESTRKTRAQLVEENEKLRHQLEERGPRQPSEASDDAGDGFPRVHERTALCTSIEFIGDFDVVQASGVDVSEGGICFEMVTALPFEMQFELNGVRQRHRALLTWMTQLEDQTYRFGFRFVSPESHPII